MDIPKSWTFKTKDIAESFDAHVREQLPWYDLVTSATCEVARHYIPNNGLVYDIGASTGNIGRRLEDILALRSAEFIPIEESADMAAAYCGPGKVVKTDAVYYDFREFDVAICFLVLMFMPPCEREMFLRKLTGKLKRGGAILVVDKTLPVGGYAGSAMSKITLAGKLAAGCSEEEIIAKELSLSGVQRPLDRGEIERLGGIEFFRFGDFAGWVLEGKDGKNPHQE